MRCRVIFEKKVSTALSQEAEVGVNERSSAGGAPARPGPWDVCGGCSCRDDVDRLAGRDVALDGVEKTNEFAMAVALHAAPDDNAVEHAERGKQGCGAVALVIVRHPLTAPGLDRQSRLGAVGGLDLARFINRQHHRTGTSFDRSKEFLVNRVDARAGLR